MYTCQMFENIIKYLHPLTLDVPLLYIRNWITSNAPSRLHTAGMLHITNPRTSTKRFEHITHTNKFSIPISELVTSHRHLFAQLSLWVQIKNIYAQCKYYCCSFGEKSILASSANILLLDLKNTEKYTNMWNISFN